MKNNSLGRMSRHIYVYTDMYKNGYLFVFSSPVYFYFYFFLPFFLRYKIMQGTMAEVGVWHTREKNRESVFMSLPCY